MIEHVSAVRIQLKNIAFIKINKLQIYLYQFIILYLKFAIFLCSVLYFLLQ